MAQRSVSLSLSGYYNALSSTTSFSFIIISFSVIMRVSRWTITFKVVLVRSTNKRTKDAIQERRQRERVRFKIFIFFASTVPPPNGARVTTAAATTTITTQNDILSVRFREPPPVECVQHMFGVRIPVRERFGYFFSHSKLNTHNNDHHVV